MMSITYTRQAEKQIDALESDTKLRVKNGIEKIPNGDITKLSGYAQTYRLRIGSYRVLFNMKKDAVEVLAVLPRKDAYKNI